MTGAKHTIDVAASASPIALGGDGAVATRIKLLSFGVDFYTRDGRGPYRLSKGEHAERVIASTKALHGSTDIVIDYDHQSVFATQPNVGGTAPAAGWIKVSGMAQGVDGIYADVEWTAAAAKMLTEREYRYISPFFKVDAASREVLRIVNAGLTNSPALELPAIASADFTQEKEDPMSTIAISVLASVLALSATATEQDVLASINGLKTDKAKADALLFQTGQSLGLAATAKPDELPVAASNIHARAEAGIDATKYVPKANFDTLQSQLATINEERVVAAVEAGVAEGKIMPSLKDWVIEQAAGDMSVVASYVDKAVAFDGDKKATEGNPSAGNAAKLTEEEAAVCSMLGLKPEDFLAARAKEQGVV